MSLKGFKFSLETPLKVKKINKMQLEIRLAEARGKMEAQRRILSRLEDEESRLNSELALLKTKGIRAGDLKEKNQYLKDLGHRISHGQGEYLRLLDTYRERQRAMIKLLNEIDMLEKLREKKVEEYLKGIEKQEEKAVEEIINYKSSIQGGKMHG